MLPQRRLWDFALETMWRWVDELAAMLRPYMAPEQVAPAPSWPRVATANIALEVARDAAAIGDEALRAQLLDEHVEVQYGHLEYKRSATRAVRGVFTIAQVDEHLRGWVNRSVESSFRPTAIGGLRDGDFEVAPGGDLVVPTMTFHVPVDSGHVKQSWSSQPQTSIEDIIAAQAQLLALPQLKAGPISRTMLDMLNRRAAQPMTGTSPSTRKAQRRRKKRRGF